MGEQAIGLFNDFTRTLEPMGLMAREREPFYDNVLRAAALCLPKLSAQPWPYFTSDSNYAPTWRTQGFGNSRKNLVRRNRLHGQRGTTDVGRTE